MKSNKRGTSPDNHDRDMEVNSRKNICTHEPSNKLRKIWIYPSESKLARSNRKLGQNSFFQPPTLQKIKSLSTQLNAEPLSRDDETVQNDKLNGKQASNSSMHPQKLANTNDLREKHNANNSNFLGGTLSASCELNESCLKRVKEAENIAGRNEMEESVRSILKHLTHEIMKYEMAIASLYGKIKEMDNENERLRQRYTLMCTDVVTAARQSNDLSTNDTAESTIEEECFSDGTEEEIDPIPSSNFSILKQELETLENRIVERLKELEENQRPIKQNALPNNEHEDDQISIVKELKQKLDRKESELKEVRKYAEIRVSNLKSSLISARTLQEKTNRKYEDTKERAKKASKLVSESNASIEHYKAIAHFQKDIIRSLRLQLNEKDLKISSASPKILQDNVPPTDYEERNSTNKSHDLLLEKYNRISAAYTVLSSVSNMQNNDLTILTQQYEEERLKSLSLMSAVEQQRKISNTVRKAGPFRESDDLKKVSKMYEDLCEQQSKEAALHDEELNRVHDMYRKLLKKKDEEHHCTIENIAQELSEFRGFSEAHSLEKNEEQSSIGDNLEEDIDKSLEPVEIDSELVRITD